MPALRRLAAVDRGREVFIDQETGETVSGATGVALRDLLRDALVDYAATVLVPTPDQCAGWVVTRATPVRNDRAGRWTLARRPAVLDAPKRMAYYATGARSYATGLDHHPSLRDLVEIARTIRGV